jgi:hypothetical protein
MSIKALSKKITDLQASWSGEWLGVRHTFQSCYQRLGVIAPFDPKSERVSRLIAAGLAISNFVEHSCKKMAKNNREPQYHSRLHTAIVIESITTLLLEQRKIENLKSKALRYQDVLLLVAMAAHDAGHNGTRNSHTCQLESRSFRLIRPLLNTAKCNEKDIYAIERIIWSTDPTLYEKLHRGAASTDFDLNYPVCQAIIAQEADILASSLPQFEKSLTEDLATEWRKVDPISAEGLLSPGGRKYFLTHYAKFSSPAARSLGLPEIIDKQLSNLT